MGLTLLTLLLLGVLAVLVVVTAHVFRDYPASELLDWKPTRSPELEAQNEVDDLRQMIEAQNEYRRRRGAEEITEADVQRQAAEDQALRARGAGPFKKDRGVIDELDAGPKKLRPPKNPKPKARAKRSAKRKPKAKPRSKGS